MIDFIQVFGAHHVITQLILSGTTIACMVVVAVVIINIVEEIGHTKRMK